MKILYILKEEADGTLQRLLEVHRKGHELQVLKLQELQDYEHLLELLEGAEKVICW
mgnify:CR=1 FL=1